MVKADISVVTKRERHRLQWARNAFAETYCASGKVGQKRDPFSSSRSSWRGGRRGVLVVAAWWSSRRGRRRCGQEEWRDAEN